VTKPIYFTREASILFCIVNFQSSGSIFVSACRISSLLSDLFLALVSFFIFSHSNLGNFKVFIFSGVCYEQ
ncbi:unnamed protein product, partial [Brassica oleracea var. botrytis]